MKNKILKVLVFLFIAIQFIPVDKTNKETDTTIDFIAQMNVSEDIANIFKTSCYDCHSNKTVYPWYFNIAPLNFWLNNHIIDGKNHLNFSEWGNYAPLTAAHKLEECIEMVEENEMPLSSYTLIHRNAELDETQKNKLLDWLKTNYKTYNKKAVLTTITGNFEDDYHYTYSINDSIWKHDTLNTYHIIKWNFEEYYLIAKNDSSNVGQQGLYTRIDFTRLKNQEPYSWGYCLTSYQSKTAEEAERVGEADRKNLKEGCNGYPFSRMKPID